VQGGAGNGILTADAVGPHHTIYTTVFIKNLASQALANTTLIGNTSATGTTNGPSIEMHNGFQYLGEEAVVNRNGASAAGAASITAGFVSGGTNNLIKPAEDVASFGVPPTRMSVARSSRPVVASEATRSAASATAARASATSTVARRRSAPTRRRARSPLVAMCSPARLLTKSATARASSSCSTRSS